MIEEIKRATDMDLKGAKIKVLAELVEHHIEEEENDLLPSFQKSSSTEDRLRLGDLFLKAKAEMFAMGADDAPKEASLSSDDLH